jgi:beta-glucanase (GH16 family)
MKQRLRALALAPLLPLGLLGVSMLSGGAATASPVLDSTSNAIGARSVTAKVSTSAPGELLVALVSANNGEFGTQTTTVSGGGLSWSLVSRENAQNGAVEVWQATAAAQLSNVSITDRLAVSDFTVNVAMSVLAFKGSAVGATAVAAAPSAAPSVTLSPTVNGSLVYGVGFDWDSATNRTVGAGQSIIYQQTDTYGDTYWMQSVTAPTAGSPVTLNDTAPTGDRFDLAAVEVKGTGGPPPTTTSTTASSSTTSTTQPTTTTTRPTTTTSMSTTSTIQPTTTTTTSTTSTTQPTTTTTIGGPGTIFDDEFTSALNPAWAVGNRPGDTTNQEAECYTPANVGVQGGSLLLSSRLDSSCSGYAYTSGYVQWQTFNFLYGTVTVRAKFPQGNGFWPAIWMLGTHCQADQLTDAGNNCGWPNPGSQEIDIAEFMGSHTQVNEQLHETGTGDPGCAFTQVSDSSTNWHTYTLVWTASSLVWKIDGSTTCTESVAVNSPMFLILNVAMGGKGGTIDNNVLPAYASFDYVRVTQP